MAFEESHRQPDKQTRMDVAVLTEKDKKIKEYQRPFLVELGIVKDCAHGPGDETQAGRGAEAPRPTEAPSYAVLPVEQLRSLDRHGALCPPDLSVLRLPPRIHLIGAELLGGPLAPDEAVAQPP